MADVIGHVYIPGIRVDGHLSRPIHLSFWSPNDAQWSSVAIRTQGIDRNRRIFESACAGNPIVADMPPIGRVEQLVLRIERDAVHIREACAFPWHTAQRLLVSGCALAIDRYFGRVLHTYKQLLLFFIDSQGKSPMRSRENSRRFQISISFARKDDDLIACVGFNRIDVAILRIDVQTIVELDISFRTSDHSFRFRVWRVCGRIVEAIEYAQSPIVVVHEDDFVESSIDRNGTVYRILIANRTDRRPSNDA